MTKKAPLDDLDLRPDSFTRVGKRWGFTLHQHRPFGLLLSKGGRVLESEINPQWFGLDTPLQRRLCAMMLKDLRFLARMSSKRNNSTP